MTTLKGLNQMRPSRILNHATIPRKNLNPTVFSTKDRRPFLGDLALREELHRYLGGILTNLNCQPIIGGGVEDHVYLSLRETSPEGLNSR